MTVAEHSHSVTIDVPAPLDEAGTSLFREAVRREIANRHEDCLRWFCSHPDTPEDVLLEIYESGLCRDDLGHRKGPRALLERMANEASYPESVLTLAIQFYTDADESDGRFERFIQQHNDDQWMLETLVRRSASSPEKESLLERVIASHPQADRLQNLIHVHRARRRAAKTDDRQEMASLYTMGDPGVWLALAGNRAVPRSLLEQLAQVKEVHLANQIRNAAQRTLAAI
jgi:hypothetical protein